MENEKMEEKKKIIIIKKVKEKFTHVAGLF